MKKTLILKIGRYDAERIIGTQGRDIYNIKRDAKDTEIIDEIDLYKETHPDEFIFVTSSQERNVIRRKIYQVKDCCVDVQSVVSELSVISIVNKNPEKRQEALKHLDEVLR